MVGSGEESSRQRERGHRKYRKPEAVVLSMFKEQPGNQSVARADWKKGR